MRRLILSALFGVGFVLASASAASAATFVVNNSGDAGDAVKGNGVCATGSGVCTLRAAIEEAEALSGPDTVTIPAMTISLGSQVNVSKSTTVQGAGGRSTIITGTPGHVLFVVTGGDVFVRDLALQGVTAGGGGGLAVYQTGNAATILERVRVVGHRVSGSVHVFGPVYVAAGEMTVRNSEISGNSAMTTGGSAEGGAIHATGVNTRVVIENSTITDNTISAGSGATSYGWGGALYLYQATGSVVSSTITNNASANSVSIAAYGGNVANFGSLTVRESVIASGAADNAASANCYGAVTFTGRNIADQGCGGASPTLTIADPQLGPLQDNGGGTNSRSPALQSPAVNAASACAFPTDQRGQQRPIGAACDLGSVEIGADVSVTQTVSNTTPVPGSDVVFTAVAANKGADAASGARLVVNLQNVQSVVSVSDSSCSVSGSSVTCDLATLQRTAPRTILIVARVPQQGDLSSTATVSSDLPDPNPADNTSTVTASVPGVPADGTPAPTPQTCTNVITGTNKADRLRGTSLRDRLRGLGGNDVVRGQGGADCLDGGRGNDRLVGGAAGDSLLGGKGRDRLAGGVGNDVITSRDGVRDFVKCGAGKDKVTADKRDRVAKDCESVIKK